MESTQLVVSVSDCIALVNQTLDAAYPALYVEGEVSSFKINHNNYVFFDLKDAEGTLNCFMTVYQLRVPLEDGMKVRVLAVPRLTKWGKFSLTVKHVAPVGEGSLRRAYELLKVKLTKEGLFDEDRKRPLPPNVETIGVISSTQAAGFADFCKIVAARWPLAHLQVAHVRVQGMGAADDIIRAIEYFNAHATPPEILALIRGGGSADDLAVFNDENLVRAIAASRVPIIVGVGHETDETLATLAADVGASTPSNAAELLAPDAHELLQRLGLTKKRLKDGLHAKLKERLQFVRHQRQSLHERMSAQLTQLSAQLRSYRQLLAQLHPNMALSRGYSLVRHNKKLLRDGRTLQPGDQLSIETSRAIINSEVLHVRSKDDQLG
ncbi:MAG TPA: exodeoxyribonuclease VII large subunit [Candidatus Saccharimonadales bacterium]